MLIQVYSKFGSTFTRSSRFTPAAKPLVFMSVYASFRVGIVSFCPILCAYPQAIACSTLYYSIPGDPHHRQFSGSHHNFPYNYLTFALIYGIMLFATHSNEQ